MRWLMGLFVWFIWSFIALSSGRINEKNLNQQIRKYKMSQELKVIK